MPAPVRDLAEQVWAHVQAGDQAALDADREAYLRLYGEAEAIAQCSIMAARPIRKAKPKACPEAAAAADAARARRPPHPGAVPAAPAQASSAT